jgi:hypothetical protein
MYEMGIVTILEVHLLSSGEMFAVCDRYEKAIAIPMRALKSVGAHIGSETHQHKALDANFPLTILTKSMPYSL